MAYLTTFLALAHRLQITGLPVSMGTVGAFWKGTREPAQPACSRSLLGVSAADPRYWLPVSGLTQKLHFFEQNQLQTKI